MIQLKMALKGILCVSVLLVGCGTRVIIVPTGEPVRLAEPVKAKVWVADKTGKEIKKEIILPEGWWALPDPGR